MKGNHPSGVSKCGTILGPSSLTFRLDDSTPVHWNDSTMTCVFSFPSCLVLHSSQTEEQVHPPLEPSRLRTEPFAVLPGLQTPRSLLEDPLNLLLRQERLKGRRRNPDSGTLKPPTRNPRLPTRKPRRRDRIQIPRGRRSRQRRRSAESMGRLSSTRRSTICTA